MLGESSTSPDLSEASLGRYPSCDYERGWPREIIDYTHGLGLISHRTTLSRFYRWDGIGTLRNLEDSDRNVVTSSVFDAYGLQHNAVTLASAYGFIGEEGVRGEKGQAPGTLVPQNMRARMYDPLTGRFTSRDPIWDKNLYAYGNGNPWGYTDADGTAAKRRGEPTKEYVDIAPSAYGTGYFDRIYYHFVNDTISVDRFGVYDQYGTPLSGYAPVVSEVPAGALPRRFTATERSERSVKTVLGIFERALPRRPGQAPDEKTLAIDSDTVIEWDPNVRWPSWPFNTPLSWSDSTPYDILLAWGTDSLTDPRNPKHMPIVKLGAHDTVTLQLQQHGSIQAEIRSVKKQLRGEGWVTPEVDRRGLRILDTHKFVYSVWGTSKNLGLKFAHGAGIYAVDAVTVLSEGDLGNLTSTMLGSFDGWWWCEADQRTRTAVIHFHVYNETGMASATRIAPSASLRPNKSSGPFRTIAEVFVWKVAVRY